MDSSKPTETGWRGSPEGWLKAAYESLIDTGVDAVRILTVAKRLKLSRTSFYWFFKDREELLAALIQQWREKNTGNLIRQSEAYAETVTDAILNVFDCWLNPGLFDSRFEFAVRSWAQQAPNVASEIHAADAARLEALKKMFIRFGSAPLSADVRARTLYLTQIGYISMQTQENLATRMARISDYVEIFTGKAPQSRELDRFFARHGYIPRTKAVRHRR